MYLYTMEINNLTNMLMMYSRQNRRLINRLNTALQNQTSSINSRLNELKEDELKEDEKTYLWSSYDGFGNNLLNPKWGSSNIALLRKSVSAYGDGKETLSVRGSNNPNPRVVSNSICKFTENVINDFNLSDMVWVWCQFLDHEID